MKKWHYAWIIVGITFLTMLVAGGIRSTPGVLMVPLEGEFGWDRSTISFAVAVNLLILGFCGPFVAAFIQRYGLKRMMLVAMLLAIVGTALTTGIRMPWQLTVLWGIVLGIGTGLILTVLGPIVANEWFVRRRGLVVGLLTASAATGQLALLPLIAWLVYSFGWREALWVLAGLSFMLVPLIFFYIRNTPGEIGLRPYGAEETSEPAVVKRATNRNDPIVIALQGLRIGIRSVPFWILALSFFVCGLSTTGLIATHLIPAGIHHGIPEVAAAGLLAMIGIFDICGTLLSGWLTDRMSSRWLLFWFYGFRGLSLLFLPFALQAGYMHLLIFAVVYGLDWVATIPPTVRLTTDFFGKERAGVLYGWIFGFHQIGASVAAFGAGYVYTLVGHYTFTFLATGILCMATAVMVLGIGKWEKNRSDSVTATGTH